MKSKTIEKTGWLAKSGIIGYELFSCKPQYVIPEKHRSPYFRTVGPQSDFYFAVPEIEGVNFNNTELAPIKITIKIKIEGKAEKAKPEYIRR